MPDWDNQSNTLGDEKPCCRVPYGITWDNAMGWLIGTTWDNENYWGGTAFSGPVVGALPEGATCTPGIDWKIWDMRWREGYQRFA